MTNVVDQYDVLIVGQGAAAFAAALYSARYQMGTIVIGEIFGGETATGGLIENYPGFPEIDGYDLMIKFREQAEKYQVPIVDDKVESMNRTEHCLRPERPREKFTGAPRSSWLSGVNAASLDCNTKTSGPGRVSHSARLVMLPSIGATW